MKSKILPLIGLAAVCFAVGAVIARLDGLPWSSKQSPIVVNTSRPVPQEVQNSAKALPDFTAATKHILPSIVSVTTLMQGETWFGERFVEPSGTGSGVVLSADGHIVTNHHVIAAGRGLADEILVKFSDGETIPAKVVGTDPRADIAVLKVERTDLVPITVGDSDTVEVGEWVIAAGNPLGFEQTVSVGIISSKGRPLQSADYAIFVDGLQTDAAINKGNSGGALCDSQGRLVGINTMIASTDQGSIGIGFAIPVNRVRSVVEDILQYGRARYGRLGISVRADSAILGIPQIRQQLQREVGSDSPPPEKGVIIVQVQPGPAQTAGIRPLDVIVAADGKPINATEDYQVFMADKKPGTKIKLKIWSRGQTRDVEVTLEDMPL